MLHLIPISSLIFGISKQERKRFAVFQSSFQHCFHLKLHPSTTGTPHAFAWWTKLFRSRRSLFLESFGDSERQMLSIQAESIPVTYPYPPGPNRPSKDFFGRLLPQ